MSKYHSGKEVKFWGDRFLSKATGPVVFDSCLRIDKGKRTSLHAHTNGRDEYFLVVHGKALFEVSSEVHLVEEGEEIFIPSCAFHRITGLADETRIVWLSNGLPDGEVQVKETHGAVDLDSPEIQDLIRHAETGEPLPHKAPETVGYEG